jgi:hypothetical protein
MQHAHTKVKLAIQLDNGDDQHKICAWNNEYAHTSGVHNRSSNPDDRHSMLLSALINLTETVTGKVDWVNASNTA